MAVTRCEKYSDIASTCPRTSGMLGLKSRMLGLPAELIQKIIGHFDPAEPDFWSLFNTCKVIRDGLMQRYNRRHVFMSNVFKVLPPYLWQDETCYNRIAILTVSISGKWTGSACNLAHTASQCPALRRLIFMCYAPVPSIESLSHLCHEIERHWPSATVLNVRPPLDVYDSRFAAKPIAIPLPLDKSRETQMKTQANASTSAHTYQVAGWMDGELQIALIALQGEYSLNGLVYRGYHDYVEADIRLRADHIEHTVSNTLLKRLGSSAYPNIGGTVNLHICMGSDKFIYVDCRIVKDVELQSGIGRIFVRPPGYLTLAWYVVQDGDREIASQPCVKCRITRTDLGTS